MKMLLTGSSGAIGMALLGALSIVGHDVACCYRTDCQKLQKFIQEANDEGRNHFMVKMDLESDESMAVGLGQIEHWCERKLGGLINNAGEAIGSLSTMTKVADLRRIMQINFFAPIQLAQRASRMMARNNGGRIVNVASTAGLTAERGMLAYGSSKAALIHATRIMALELASQKISVNAVAPSPVDSPMAQKMDQSVLRRMVEGSAIGRLIEIDEVVRLVMFLLLDAPASLTGEIIRLDGGMQ